MGALPGIDFEVQLVLEIPPRRVVVVLGRRLSLETDVNVLVVPASEILALATASAMETFAFALANLVSQTLT